MISEVQNSNMLVLKQAQKGIDQDYLVEQECIRALLDIAENRFR